MERWSGKVAVVTGASAGIGAAVCVTLANHGLTVIGLARRQQLIDKLKSDVTGKGSILSRKCDIGKPIDIRTTFEWVVGTYGAVDLLVNNAGIIYPGHITDFGDAPVKEEDIISTIDVNLKGMVLCTRHALSSMKNRGIDGHIININSIAGHYIPISPAFNVYSNTKHGVTAFTSALLNELSDCGCKVKVTSISPGLVKTDMTIEALNKVSFTPLSPQDVADALVYVVSTPPNVNISELTIQPVSEKKL